MLAEYRWNPPPDNVIELSFSYRWGSRGHLQSPINLVRKGQEVIFLIYILPCKSLFFLKNSSKAKLCEHEEGWHGNSKRKEN